MAEHGSVSEPKLSYIVGASMCSGPSCVVRLPVVCLSSAWLPYAGPQIRNLNPMGSDAAEMEANDDPGAQGSGQTPVSLCLCPPPRQGSNGLGANAPPSLGRPRAPRFHIASSPAPLSTTTEHQPLLFQTPPLPPLTTTIHTLTSAISYSAPSIIPRSQQL